MDTNSDEMGIQQRSQIGFFIRYESIPAKMTFLRTCICVFFLGVVGVTLSPAQQKSMDDAMQGRVYVQFSVEVASTGTGKTGIGAFDELAEIFGVVSVEKAFPSLEVMARNRPLSKEAQELLNVYLVLYESPHESFSVASALEKVAEVVYAEPVYKYQLNGSSPKTGL